MALQFLFPSQSSSPAREDDGEFLGLALDREDMVTAIAIVLALLVVAAIAALMGMS